MGFVKKSTGSYAASLYFLCGSMLLTAAILFSLDLGRKAKPPAVGETEPA
jgi:hypothetical protein